MSAVEDILQERKIPFRVSGKDLTIPCLNPNHEDRNPSMRIDRELGIFNCFSCGYKGNIFKFYGVEASEVGLKRERLKRKMDDIRSAGVGLAMPDNTTPFLRDWRGISASTYEKFGAFYHIHSDFNGRVNFPIKDASGRIVCFQGRDETGTLPQKYMFTPSGSKPPMFPMAEPVRGKIMLVEGIFDMLNLHDKGMTNAICIFGVNNFSEEKLGLLKISGVTGIDVAFDGDDAGRKGVEKVKEICGDFPVRDIKLTKGDPGDLNRQQVEGLWRRLYG